MRWPLAEARHRRLHGHDYADGMMWDRAAAARIAAGMSYDTAELRSGDVTLELARAWDALPPRRGVQADFYDSHAYLASWSRVKGPKAGASLRIPSVLGRRPSGRPAALRGPLAVALGVGGLTRRFDTDRARYRPVLGCRAARSRRAGAVGRPGRQVGCTGTGPQPPAGPRPRHRGAAGRAVSLWVRGAPPGTIGRLPGPGRRRLGRPPAPLRQLRPLGPDQVEPPQVVVGAGGRGVRPPDRRLGARRLQALRGDPAAELEGRDARAGTAAAIRSCSAAPRRSAGAVCTCCDWPGFRRPATSGSELVAWRSGCRPPTTSDWPRSAPGRS